MDDEIQKKIEAFLSAIRSNQSPRILMVGSSGRTPRKSAPSRGGRAEVIVIDGMMYQLVPIGPANGKKQKRGLTQGPPKSRRTSREDPNYSQVIARSEPWDNWDNWDDWDNWGNWDNWNDWGNWEDEGGGWGNYPPIWPNVS